MKKNVYSLLFLFTFLSITQSCKKKEAAPEPDPYTYSADVQTAKDISLATMAISDLEMLCSFLGENSIPSFYAPSNGSFFFASNRDTTERIIKIGYNQDLCIDGKLRNGYLFMNYSGSPKGANYYRSYGYVAKIIILSNFIVNGWKISLYDNEPIEIRNMVTPAGYNPAGTNLSWQIKGQLSLEKVGDSTRNLTWNGTLLKTLVNTQDPTVFAGNKQSAINWKKAVVNYTGDISGFTGQAGADLPYSLSIGESPLKRDFNCNVIPPNSSVTEYHPFITGSSIFKSANFHPRTIDYGPADPGACDNKGVISFKDEHHDFDIE